MAKVFRAFRAASSAPCQCPKCAARPSVGTASPPSPLDIRLFWDAVQTAFHILGYDRPRPPRSLADALRDRRERTPETHGRLEGVLRAGLREPAARTMTPKVATSGTAPAAPDLAAAIRAAKE
jgi:hypothetical protein